MPRIEPTFDYHEAITRKERSSRYIRTAFDYLAQVQGEAALDEFLADVGIERNSSIFKHIYDDENWNSYQLEVFLYENIKDRFEDPYKAIWEFGIASGSGKLDQKDTLFTFKIKIAPVETILRKISEHTERVTLVSQTSAEILSTPSTILKGGRSARMLYKYSRLPKEFQYPSWTSVVAGFGIAYAMIRFRKGIPAELKITHWPNLPSDLPSVGGKVYEFDKQTKNIIEKESGAVVANAKDGPFELAGATWNNGDEAVAHFEWIPEGILTTLAKLTIHRRATKREEALQTLRSQIVEELTGQHQKQLAAYKAELSEKTRLIQEQMERIHQMKVQQDGDYFLTSLLTGPLIADRNKSDAVQTSMHVEQKKKFEFRKWKSEIGGDACITDQVQLRGRSYTVFLNGDAMGKSMQGAGGAIVLGVIFHTYLNRSRFSSYQKQKSPELWLRDAALDLQNAYMSFQGSMFVSLVMGLVDEQSGLMYFINAEHPWIVLLRKGKAQFLGEDMLVRKIGTPGVEESLRIRTFQLEQGDCVFIGSDGRDDLEIGKEGETRIINEDETLFLRTVEQAEGRLDLIVEKLKETGKITDDLSILRVEFQGTTGGLSSADSDYRSAIRQAIGLGRMGKLKDATQILESLYRNHPDRVEPLRYLGRLQYVQKSYPEAAETLKEFFAKHQGDSAVQYLIARACKLAGQFAEAIDYGERCMLREPDHLNNLLNLADSYRLAGNDDRAKQILARAIQIAPDHSGTRKLEQLIRPHNDH